MSQNKDWRLIRRFYGPGRNRHSQAELISIIHHAWRIYLRIDSKARFTIAFARSIL